MKFSLIKMNAQKKLIKNHFICFCVSVLPYVTIVLLTLLNYYLYIFLKVIDFDFIPFISSYDVYVKTDKEGSEFTLKYADLKHKKITIEKIKKSLYNFIISFS